MVGEEDLLVQDDLFAASVMEAAIAASTGDHERATKWNQLNNPVRKSLLSLDEVIWEESVTNVSFATCMQLHADAHAPACKTSHP